MFPCYPGAGRSREHIEAGWGWSDVDVMVKALDGKRNGSTAMVRCPAHDDKIPSLSIKISETGKPLVHCFAGCQQHDVVAALKAIGLWKAAPATMYQDLKGRRKQAERVARRVDDWPVTAVYDYTDASGQVVYQIRRHELNGDKTFRAWRPDGRGGFAPRGPTDSEKVLYRYREVLEAPIVFIAEGEKDCETLREHGFVATTNPFGANQPWLPQYTEALAGREVILIPDNDKPGREHMAKVARALFGKVARLRVLELGGVKDVSEWFDRGYSEVGLINLLDPEEVGR